jgi:abequosyltransferase
MRLSIAIPAYNRPQELAEALESIASQALPEIEIVVSDDRSPRAAEVRDTVERFKARYPNIAVRYFENADNLGYDGNLRSLLDKSSGDYVFFLGDDDRVPPGALASVLAAIAHDNIGVVLRAWQSFDGKTGQVTDVHHYFPGDRIFSSGASTVAAFFRRSVFISGLTVHRAAAQSLHTSEFDGLLLYQLYLVGRLLLKMDGYYIDSIVAERRTGGEHFFGSSQRERGRFEPNKLEAHHSARFLAGLFQIASRLDMHAPGVGAMIRRDLGRYSYPMLEIQAVRLPRLAFGKYGFRLARLGLGREPLFWIYCFGLMFLGPRCCRWVIERIIRLRGSTPVLTGVSGKAVS